MSEPEVSLIGPDEPAYRLELTAAQLKVTYAALKSMLDDFGHDERDVHRVLREALLTLRALIDWYLERLDRPRREPEVENIPID